MQIRTRNFHPRHSPAESVSSSINNRLYTKFETTSLDTIEKRSGRWLKELARQNQTTGFDLNAWIPVWDACGSERQIRGRN